MLIGVALQNSFAHFLLAYTYAFEVCAIWITAGQTKPKMRSESIVQCKDYKTYISLEVTVALTPFVSFFWIFEDEMVMGWSSLYRADRQAYGRGQLLKKENLDTGFGWDICDALGIVWMGSHRCVETGNSDGKKILQSLGFHLFFLVSSHQFLENPVQKSLTQTYFQGWFMLQKLLG